MYSDDLNAPPVNPLPNVVILLCCLVGGVELVFQMAEAGFIGGQEGIGWRISAMQQYAFSDRLFDWMRVNGRAIYGCSQSEFAEPDGCRFTQNGDRLYLHIYNFPFLCYIFFEVGSRRRLIFY